MKKLTVFLIAILGLVIPASTIHAQDFNSIIGNISPPTSIKGLVAKGGATGLSIILSNLIQLIFVISSIAVVFMVLLGGFQWITSGGDKEALGKARSRITNAIIGLILLSLTFFILAILGKILHFTFFV